MKNQTLFNTLTILLFCGLGSSLIFVSGCSDQPSQMNQQTPRASVQRLENGAFINPNGWHVPETVNTRKAAPRAETLNSEQGKSVQVSITAFTPIDTVLYEEPFFANGVTQLYGELVLKRFDEYRANDKVYSILITAKNRETTAQKNVNAHNEMLVYRIVDSDGDGTFETLFDEDRDVPVPLWACIEPRH